MSQSSHATPRSAPRLPIPLMVRLGTSTGQRSRNVSLSGLFIETQDKPPLGAILPLLLIWDRWEAETRVRIVRHATDGVGVSYLQPDEPFLHVIEQIIEEIKAEQHLPQLLTT